MKKTLLTSLAGLLLGTAALAQSPITLKWADYGQFPPTDTVGLVSDLLPLANIRNAATNGVWDLSSLTYSRQEVILRDSVQVINSGGFPGYVYNQTEKLAAGNLYFPGKVQYLRDTFSLRATGFSMAAATIGIDSLTGVQTDSFYVPQQVVSFSGSPEIAIKFPASMDSSWTSNTQYTVNYEMTVAAAQYNHYGFSRTVTRQVDGTVIGWGRALVRNVLTGQPNVSIDVLQVEVIEVTTNQFTGGGAGPDTTVLNALNLQYGRSDTTSSIWLLRRGETTPLLNVSYRGVPSSTPAKARIHLRNVFVPNSVPTIAAAGTNVKIYPNPVRRGGNLFVDCEGSGDWQLRLSSLTGQKVHEVRWAQTQSSPQAVQLPQELAGGMYIFQLIQNGQSVKTGRVLVSE